jgi:catalase
VQVQVMPFADAADYRFNPFDLTKVWPHADYPPITLGRITLDKNPDNYFAEIEQAAFEPANPVPGVAASPDKMLQARLFCYPDTHRYRIGTNYLQIPVNQPKAAAVHSYNKDGAMRYVNPNDPVYAPNSYGGPTADQGLYTGETYLVAGDVVRSAYAKHRDDDDFVQRRTLVEHVMSDEDRDDLVTNIAKYIKGSAP